ncbi:glutamine--tRNA ligase/YqeY domain fusion protein [candidate division KSB1 bacterium]|nr:glutamine--tRNA ligase/YqeY domain fusion protein [candidate division KSB1 bacterium]RQW00724.1 MAG: glutamine--tRNA ligase/YqeY domain fusion protein [candidate division KSB1 bacterium]
MDNNETAKKKVVHFIRQIINKDIAENKKNSQVITRFPPEPNGYLHIGHAKSICLNFGLAEEYNGRCHLRFDDTNPIKEEQEYIDAIIEDVRWLGFDWGEHLYFASDYFEQMYAWAVQLIRAGKAYVDGLTTEQIREYRGTLTEPGVNSPYRNRSIEENLDLFERMRKGDYKDGEMVLRARIDMGHPNMNMRDPVMYRILHAKHPRTGDKWCIYPMYDWAHGLEDSIEGITHSICTLEFEDHRPLYDWFLDQLGIYHPQQIEFARLNLTFTIMSKRYLLKLVKEGIVSGWDDPRMPTISGLRRRGYTPAALRDFSERVGVAKRDSIVDSQLLEHCLREDLNRHAPRVMGVLNPLKVVITNYPEGKVEEFEAINNPEDEAAGVRKVPFSREIYIEREDFMLNPPKKFFRLAPGREVRLRYAYYITCTDVLQDEKTGDILELHCTYDPESRGGYTPDGRKVRSTIHWVSLEHAIDAEVRQYDYLLTVPDPSAETAKKEFMDYINPNSLTVLHHCKVEPSLVRQKVGFKCQFERKGYFMIDPDSKIPEGTLVFNQTVSLRDTWAKIAQAESGKH